MQQRAHGAALADDRRMILKHGGSSSGRQRKTRRSVAVAGILVSTFLHTLLLVPLVLGYGQQRQRAQPNVQGTPTLRPEAFSPETKDGRGSELLDTIKQAAGATTSVLTAVGQFAHLFGI